MLKLPPRIQEALRKSQLTMGHARALAALSDEKIQLRLFDQLIKKDLNVRQVENLVRETGKKSEKKLPALRKTSATGVESISDRIQQILATKVKVNLQSGAITRKQSR